MSQQTVAEVIARALLDARFRSQLVVDPDAALSGYDLTEEERAKLGDLDENALEALASEIEERLSKILPVPIPIRRPEAVPDVLRHPAPNAGVMRLVEAEIHPLDLTRLLES